MFLDAAFFHEGFSWRSDRASTEALIDGRELLVMVCILAEFVRCFDLADDELDPLHHVHITSQPTQLIC